MPLAYLLNPPKRRKARRHKGRGSRRVSRRLHCRVRRQKRYTHPTRRYLRKVGRRARRSASRRRKNPSRRRRHNARGWFKRKGSYKGSIVRRFPRRRRNPGGMGGMLALATPQTLLPIHIPLPGILGKVANGMVQGVAIGVAAFGGYVLSGYVVDLFADKAKVAASGSNFVKNWGRPLAFAGLAGLTGGVVAMLAPKGRKASWALAASAGPAIRAVAGALSVLISPTSTGILANMRSAAGNLADYVQVGDFYEAGVSDFQTSDGGFTSGDGGFAGPSLYEAGVSDYVQVGGDDYLDQ